MIMVFFCRTFHPTPTPQRSVGQQHCAHRCGRLPRAGQAEAAVAAQLRPDLRAGRGAAPHPRTAHTVRIYAGCGWFAWQ